MGKVTMQDIADALSVSRVTVSKAFNEQSGVSDSLRSLIFEKAKELGYNKFPTHVLEQQEQTADDQKTISLVVSRPESSPFWTNIIHRMAQELASHNINMIYTYVPSVYTSGFSLPASVTGNNIDAIVVLNVYDAQILGLINQLPTQKVFLDTIPSLPDFKLNGDLILIEGYRTTMQITDYLIENGHERIGFIGDIDYAQTNMERYFGYRASMDHHHLDILPEYCMTNKIDIYSYEEQLNLFFDSLTEWPSAFVCVSDYVANFTQSYIDAHPERVKGPVTLTGFDNNTEFTNLTEKITTANVPTGLLGKRLAIQLLFRTEHPNAPNELTYIKPSILYRNPAVPLARRVVS